MNSPSPVSTQPLLLPRIVWLALFTNQAFLLGVLLLILPARTEGAPEKSIDQILQHPLYGILIAIAFVAGLLSKSLPPRLVPAEAIRTLNEETPNSKLFFVPFVVRLALIDLIPILGFVAALSASDWRFIAPFLAAGALLMILSFPKGASLGFFPELENQRSR